MDFITSITDWVKARFAERSTWDGTVIAGVSLAVLLASPFLKYIAMAGLAYGVYRMVQKELG